MSRITLRSTRSSVSHSPRASGTSLPVGGSDMKSQLRPGRHFHPVELLPCGSRRRHARGPRPSASLPIGSRHRRRHRHESSLRQSALRALNRRRHPHERGRRSCLLRPISSRYHNSGRRFCPAALLGCSNRSVSWIPERHPIMLPIGIWNSPSLCRRHKAPRPLCTDPSRC